MRRLCASACPSTCNASAQTLLHALMPYCAQRVGFCRTRKKSYMFPGPGTGQRRTTRKAHRDRPPSRGGGRQCLWEGEAKSLSHPCLFHQKLFSCIPGSGVSTFRRGSQESVSTMPFASEVVVVHTRIFIVMQWCKHARIGILPLGYCVC